MSDVSYYLVVILPILFQVKAYMFKADSSLDNLDLYS